jgi:nitrogen-specific signal transduction histidine kinase
MSAKKTVNGITSPVTALFKELHSNHDAIHKCVQSLNQIKAHDEEMQRLEDDRAAFDEETQAKIELEDRQILLRRAREDEERRINRQEKSRTFHENMDSEMSKLEDDIAEKLKGGDLDLQALLSKRKVRRLWR